jgi:tetratricopeptide (TPR) repeat protein
MNHRWLIFCSCAALLALAVMAAVPVASAQPQSPAVKDALPSPDQIRQKRDEAFWKYYPHIEEGNNLMKLKTVALLERRKAAPIEPYLKIMQDDLAKAGEDSLRGVCIRSALAFAHVAQHDSDAAQGAEIQVKLLQMKTWPAGSEKVREETIRDFLRFTKMREYGQTYRATRWYHIYPHLFEEYVSPDNPSPAILPFGRNDSTDNQCFDIVRRTRMQMKGKFAPLKKAGIYCGEIGEWTECERLLGWAVEAAPDDAARREINETLSDYMLKAGKTGQALVYYRQVHPEPESDEAALRFVVLLRADKQLTEAQRILDDLLTGTPPTDTLDKVGLCLIQMKDYPQAIECLERYPLKFDGDALTCNASVRVAFNLAAAYESAQKRDEALTLLRRVVANRRTGEGFDTSNWDLCAAMLKRLSRAPN